MERDKRLLLNVLGRNSSVTMKPSIKENEKFVTPSGKETIPRQSLDIAVTSVPLIVKVPPPPQFSVEAFTGLSAKPDSVKATVVNKVVTLRIGKVAFGREILSQSLP
jgi:hypothetical protein